MLELGGERLSAAASTLIRKFSFYPVTNRVLSLSSTGGELPALWARDPALSRLALCSLVSVCKPRLHRKIFLILAPVLPQDGCQETVTASEHSAGHYQERLETERQDRQKKDNQHHAAFSPLEHMSLVKVHGELTSMLSRYRSGCSSGL